MRQERRQQERVPEIEAEDYWREGKRGSNKDEGSKLNECLYIVVVETSCMLIMCVNEKAALRVL